MFRAGAAAEGVVERVHHDLDEVIYGFVVSKKGDGHDADQRDYDDNSEHRFIVQAQYLRSMALGS